MKDTIISNFELIKHASIYLLIYIPKEELMIELIDLKTALNNDAVSTQFAVAYITQSSKLSEVVLEWIKNNKILNEIK